MKALRLVLVVSLFFILCTPTVMASSGWDPLDGISHLVTWFQQLNNDFDALVVSEKKAQLLRAVDRLRKSLYQLEVDTRFLIDSIPTECPDLEQRGQIKGYVKDLLRTVRRLSGNLREVGADLRLADQTERFEAESILTRGLGIRRAVLTEVEQELMESHFCAPAFGSPWRPDWIRTRLQVGLNAVKDAQIAITEFQRKITASD